MSNPASDPEDARLSSLLRNAQTLPPELPSNFQNAVWRRIERAENSSNVNWLETLAGCLFRPRLALGGLAAAMLLGTIGGVVSGTRTQETKAQMRYVTAVDPFQKQP